MIDHTKRRIRQFKRTGIALLLLFAILCTTMPIQAEAISPMPENTDKEIVSDKVSEVSQPEPATENETGQPKMPMADPGQADGANTTGQPEASPTPSDSGQDLSVNAMEGDQPTDIDPSGSPVQNGLVQEGNHYLLYQDGAQVKKEGWQETSEGKFYISASGYVTARMEEIGGSWRHYEYDINTFGWAAKKNSWSHVLGTDYYFDNSGACVKAYNVNTSQLSVFSNGQMVSAAKQAHTLSDGELYYFAAKGIRATAPGWKKASSQERYYVGAKGSISAKMEAVGGTWQYYEYNSRLSSWKKLQNAWKTIDGKEYFFGNSGKCTKIYTPSSGKCQEYSKGKMALVKKDTATLQDGRIYYFNAQGKRVAKAGWQKISSEKYLQICSKGYVSDRLVKSKGIWKTYKYNYSAQKWEIQKNTWKSVGGKDYFFSKNGRCTIIYNTSTLKCQKYSKGKMKTIKNTLCVLKNNKIYYFNIKGVCSQKAGWKKISANQYARVGKGGYVTHKITNTSGNWKYYKQNYKIRKWQKQKKSWVTVKEKKYYFNAKGDCTQIYYIRDKKCYDYKNGHMTLVRNDIRNIDGKKWYFGTDGKKVSAAGLYITSVGKLIYVNAKGNVTKEIRGTVMDYTSSDGRVTNCKVKDASSICYYNGLGILIRKLDLNEKMVALTYDDGPSPYTSVILDVLEQSHSVATFFVIGQQVSAHASILKRAYDMGCEIGNHTYSHQTLTKVGVPVIQSQISSTNTAVRNVTGASPVVMRPPGGAYNSTVASAVGMPLILWSIDTLDWKTRNAASTQAAVLNNIKDGDIVLMHDLYAPTAEASKAIIPELISRGYQLVTVSELADCRGGMINGMVYSAFR